MKSSNCKQWIVWNGQKISRILKSGYELINTISTECKTESPRMENLNCDPKPT